MQNITENQMAVSNFPLFFVPDSLNDRVVQKETIMFFWKCIRGHDALEQIQKGKNPNADYVKYIIKHIECYYAYIGIIIMIIILYKKRR